MNAPLIDVRPDHWVIVRDVLRKHVPAYDVWAFGSRAKWTAKEFSDLDLAVITDKALNLQISGALADAFSESDLPWKVDVVDWATTSDAFRKVIERDKVVVQVGAESTRTSGEWRECTLGDLCDAGIAELQTGPFGTQLHAHDYVDDGVPVVPTEAIRNRQIDHSVLPEISLDKSRELARHRLEPGDILFARRGVQATGHIGYVREAEDGFICGTGAIRLRVRRNANSVSPDFLSHVLANPVSVDWFKFHAIGATMPNLNESIIRSFPLKVPPLAEQRAIAHILGTLDDKIELNRQMSKTLEEMARALFKSWFVDFDPVRAKAGGRDPGLPRPVADLFPDSFKSSELGEIPKGWEVGALGELVETVKGRSYKSDELVESPTALVTLKSFARGGGYRPDGLKSFAGTYKPEQIVKPGELVIACTDVTQAAEVIGRPAIVRGTGRYQTLVASLDTLIVRPRHSGTTRAFLYFLGGTEAFVAHTYAHTTGTTVLHLSKEAIPSFMFARPSLQLVEQFDSLARPVLERIQAFEEESGSLTALRDALLPKLLSGDLRLATVEGVS